MFLFAVTVIYEDGSEDRFVTDQFNTIDEIRRVIFSNKTPLGVVATTSGGYLFDRQKRINKVLIRKRTIGGHVMSEHEFDQDGNPTSEAVNESSSEMPQLSPPKPNLVVYGEVANTFESFREKFLQSAQSQASWMNQIVEKMVKREQLLQKAKERLEEETAKLEELVNNKVGE